MDDRLVQRYLEGINNRKILSRSISGYVCDEPNKWSSLFQRFKYDSGWNTWSIDQNWRKLLQTPSDWQFSGNVHRNTIYSRIVEEHVEWMLNDQKRPFHHIIIRFSRMFVAEHHSTDSVERSMQDLYRFLSEMIDCLLHYFPELRNLFKIPHKFACISCSKSQSQTWLHSNDNEGIAFASRALVRVVYKSTPIVTELFKKSTETLDFELKQKIGEMKHYSLKELGADSKLCRIPEESIEFKVESNELACICREEDDLECKEELKRMFAKPIKVFSRLDQMTNPIDQIDVIMKTAFLISQELEGRVQINADDLVVLFMYIVLQSECDHIHAYLAMIRSFLQKDMKMSLCGYYLVTVEASLQAISTFSKT